MNSQDNSQSPPIAPAVASGKIPVIPVSYYGRGGEVLKLHIVNLLLNIITLGIYSFWGKTRIRRYMTSHLSIAQDRFEYTGTGKELLVGALKALVIFLPIVLLMGIPVVNIVAYIAFFAILSVALFLALRYRLSRTRWRGIRFSLGGSVKDYLILSLKRTLINVVTLGWKIPQSDLMKWSYIANNMSYGDTKFSFAGDVSRLQKTHIKTLAIAGLCFILGPAFGGMMVAAAKSADSDAAIVPGIILIYAGLGCGLFARLWYYAALWQEKFRGLKIGQLRFKSYVTGSGMAKLYIVNMLMIIFTLGLAKPIAAQRVLRYHAQNLKIGGDINELIAEQAKPAEKSAIGDALAADVGFDLGL